jgi:glycosyltransferase involved in cell wall biosynthesis
VLGAPRAGGDGERMPGRAVERFPDTSAQRPMRLAHIVTHPIPYYAPLYRELSSRPEVELTVFFASDFGVREYEDPGFGRSVAWDTPLLEGYRYRFMPSARGRELTGGRMFYKPNLDIIRSAGDGSFDAVWVHGYANVNAWFSFALTQLRGRTFLVRDDPILQHSRPGWRRMLKYPILRAVFSRAGGLYTGEQNRRYLIHYGMPEERLFRACHCVDNAFFQAKANELAPRRESLRDSLGVGGGDPVLLFCGKFVAKKQPLRIIEAFARLRGRRRCRLLMVGEGELRPAAERLVAQRGVPDVVFAGFLNQSEIVRAYAAADAFVLFSSHFETWGLVVNEAMNFGLPVVVSDQVGCGEDLVHEGQNGHIVAHDDVDALASALEAVFLSPEHADKLGARSREIIDEYSVERCADGIVAACETLARG